MAARAEHGDECTQPGAKRTKQNRMRTALYGYPTVALWALRCKQAAARNW